MRAEHRSRRPRFVRVRVEEGSTNCDKRGRAQAWTQLPIRRAVRRRQKAAGHDSTA